MINKPGGVTLVRPPFGGGFKDRTVLLTGHTGFKGSWLSIWLNELGAKVVGYGLGPPTEPSNFEVSGLARRVVDIRGDVRDIDCLGQAIDEYQPELIFHLAAQALVLRSLDDPKTTFDTNVGGTVNVLEAAKRSKRLRAIVCVTSDKCYENRDWLWGYRENDTLGGRDPYSASKAMAELAIAAYRGSILVRGQADGREGPAVASARAGNVIGGGDFTISRLVPDCMRALMAGGVIPVRSPGSVRPWQHVLESLSGYLCLGAALLEHGQDFAEAWNFGPVEPQGVDTRTVVEKSIELWGSGSWTVLPPKDWQAETRFLRLNWEKAAHRLGWGPAYTWQEALTETVRWFKTYHSQVSRKRAHAADMYDICVQQIQRYAGRSRQLNSKWAGSGEPPSR